LAPPSILQEELSFFREKKLIGREIELLGVHIGISEIGVDSKIRNQV
jgi:hypothetical protein